MNQSPNFVATLLILGSDSCVSASDIIPTPAIGSALPAHDISDAVPRQDYDALNQEAEASSTTSKKLEQSLEQVQQLLHPNKLTQ